MTLRLTNTQLGAICEHAERAYPGECCGALGGRIDGEANLVDQVLPAQNVHEEGPACRFLIGGSSVAALEREARAGGYAILGFYHSHPDCPARPSEYDTAHATWPEFSFLIVEVAGGVSQDIRSWRLSPLTAAYTEEPVEIVGTAIV
jgi:proteasome lid subunit RPN8/RPN11